MSVLEKIRKLDEQKAALLAEAKSEALGKAQAAIKELNSLGFNYQLVQGEGSAPTARSSSGGRRTGIRDEVLAAIKSAGAAGIKPAGIRAALNLEGKSASQSVANALTALKGDSKIAKDGDVYKAV